MTYHEQSHYCRFIDRSQAWAYGIIIGNVAEGVQYPRALSSAIGRTCHAPIIQIPYNIRNAPHYSNTVQYYGMPPIIPQNFINFNSIPNIVRYLHRTTHLITETTP